MRYSLAGDSGTTRFAEDCWWSLSLARSMGPCGSCLTPPTGSDIVPASALIPLSSAESIGSRSCATTGQIGHLDSVTSAGHCDKFQHDRSGLSGLLEGAFVSSDSNPRKRRRGSIRERLGAQKTYRIYSLKMSDQVIGPESDCNHSSQEFHWVGPSKTTNSAKLALPQGAYRPVPNGTRWRVSKESEWSSFDAIWAG